MKTLRILIFLVAIGLMMALCALLNGCASDPSRPPINVQIPLGEDGKYGAIILATGWVPPESVEGLKVEGLNVSRPVSLWDGKEVVR